jgi:hypothetical protein
MADTWEEQHEIILKNWGEISACYGWMHDRAYRHYKVKNMHYAIPVIILSTLTGTANFAQQNIPERYRSEAIMIIGGLNLLSGLITTLAQFFKVNELQETHRSSSVMFSKFSRYISVELNLPKRDRCSDGAIFVENCRQEYNRMLEQSPSIPDNILLVFNKKYRHALFSKPVITHLEEIKIFKDINSHEHERRKKIQHIQHLKHQETMKNINNNSRLLSFKLPGAIRSQGLDDSSEDEPLEHLPSDDQINIEMQEIKINTHTGEDSLKEHENPKLKSYEI